MNVYTTTRSASYSYHLSSEKPSMELLVLDESSGRTAEEEDDVLPVLDDDDAPGGSSCRSASEINPDATAATPQMKNITRKKAVTSKVKRFAKSIASAPVQLAQSMVSNHHHHHHRHTPLKNRGKSEQHEPLDIAANDLLPPPPPDYQEDDEYDDEAAEEDDSIDSETFEEVTSSPKARDSRLSAVAELSREWSDDAFQVGGESSSSEDDDDKEIDDDEIDDDEEEPSSTDVVVLAKSGDKKGSFGRANKMAAKMGRAAVKLAKAPLNVTKRGLETAGEEGNERHPKDALSSSPKSSTASSKMAAAPGKVVSKMKDVAVGISKVPNNILTGMKHGKNSSLLPSNSSAGPKAATGPTSRPPLTSRGSTNDGSLVSFLASNPNGRSYRGGLLSDSSSGSNSGLSLLGSTHSVRTQSYHGSQGTGSSVASCESVFSSMGSMPSLASMTSTMSLLENSPSTLRSKRSVLLSSLGSMPSLATISHHDLVVDSPSARTKRSMMVNGAGMTSLALIPQLDSTVSFDDSFGTVSTHETNETGVSTGGAFSRLALPLVHDNCAGTRLDELAPAVNILLNTRQPDKQQQRWAPCGDRTAHVPQSLPAVPSYYSSRYSTNDSKALGNEANIASESNDVPLDSAPRVACRRSSVEIPALDSSGLSEIFSPLSSLPIRRASGSKTIPLWSVGGMVDSTPTMARRRSSGSSRSNVKSMADAAAEVAALDEQSSQNSKSRATRRRSSQNVIPLPTLMEHDSSRDVSETASMAAAAAEVAAVFDEDEDGEEELQRDEDYSPRVAQRRRSFAQDAVPMPSLPEDDNDGGAGADVDERPMVGDSMPLPARRRVSDILR